MHKNTFTVVGEVLLSPVAVGEGVCTMGGDLSGALWGMAELSSARFLSLYPQVPPAD